MHAVGSMSVGAPHVAGGTVCASSAPQPARSGRSKPWLPANTEPKPGTFVPGSPTRGGGARGWGSVLGRRGSDGLSGRAASDGGIRGFKLPFRPATARDAAAGAVGGMGRMVSDIASKMPLGNVGNAVARRGSASRPSAIAFPELETHQDTEATDLASDPADQAEGEGPVRRFMQFMEGRQQAEGNSMEESSSGKVRTSERVEGFADISDYLQETGTRELRYIRMLSSLNAMTYMIPKLTDRSVWKRHKLRLVTSSIAMREAEKEAEKEAVKEKRSSVFGPLQRPPVSIDVDEEIAVAPDRMAHEVLATGDGQAWVLGPEALPAVPKIPQPVAAYVAAPSVQEVKKKKINFPDVSAPLSLAARLGNNAAAATAGVVMGAVATATTAAGAFRRTDSPGAAAAEVDGCLEDGAPLSDEEEKAQFCPSEWFVCDSKDGKVRYFVIQGSDSMASWKTNLAFDPCTFEDPALRLRVHRGFYNASMSLYQTLLPLVREHLAAGAGHKVCFTGHSLGGSLATLIGMMLVHRGECPTELLKPMYTFGSSAALSDATDNDNPESCEVSSDDVPMGTKFGGLAEVMAAAVGGVAHADSLHARSLELAGGYDARGLAEAIGTGAWVSEDEGGATEAGELPGVEEGAVVCAPRRRRGITRSTGPDSILTRVGLPANHVRNVMMNNDLVPRALTCDYSPVQQILLSGALGVSFKAHAALSAEEQQVLYTTIGTQLVLQPTGKGFEEHPQLPPGPGLYTFRERTGMRISRGVPKGGSSVAREYPTSLQRGNFDSMALERAWGRNEITSVDDAIFSLMNFPHPLEILADPAAYGPEGTVSRYHNPDNYTRALSGVLKQRKFSWHIKGVPGEVLPEEPEPGKFAGFGLGVGMGIRGVPKGSRAVRGAPRDIKNVREAQTRRANQTWRKQ